MSAPDRYPSLLAWVLVANAACCLAMAWRLGELRRAHAAWALAWENWDQLVVVDGTEEAP